SPVKASAASRSRESSSTASLSPNQRWAACNHPPIRVLQHDQRRLAAQSMVGHEKARSSLGIKRALPIRDRAAVALRSEPQIRLQSIAILRANAQSKTGPFEIEDHRAPDGRERL